MFQRDIEVPAMDYQLRTKSFHRGIFIRAVTLGHHDDGWQTTCICRKGNTLAMITARCRAKTSTVRFFVE